MRKEICLAIFLLLGSVIADHDGHDHGDHSHENHNHGDHGISHEDHSHDQGGSSHDHAGDSHDHGNHDHQGEDHHHHDHAHDSDGPLAGDCSVHLNAGQTQSGVYTIKPPGCHHAIQVFCDMHTDGGGWTVIQKRGEYGNDADYFYKTWDEYKDGFGDKEKEHWIGNYHINHLTEHGVHELRIDLWNLADNHTYAKYGSFRIENETLDYAIHVGEFSGDTRDCMTFIDGMKFSTRDRDNDLYDSSCAEAGHGAWWYKDCSSSNLNGPHQSDLSQDISKSIYWFGLDGNPQVLKATQMMVRPKA